ncbi:MBL fold metallo-hydrolase [Cellulomonas endophytica]|uniref:MBL fold metallo-hydrolase n=1 Tax=Cellulomonas endophytica TaxID=2494735 RepID=UPI001013B25B|nr:MBL fold metallo-hydrolase [Cellulomonas endophytica]
MSTLTHWGHSCVRLDLPGGALVLDPGGFSDVDAALDGATAVLVTHDHFDHVQAEPLAAWLAGDAGAAVHVWGPAAVVDALVAAGVPSDRAHAVRPGDTVEAAGATVQVLGGRHAVIHPDLPGLDNVGYLVEGVLHPGDAYTLPPEGTAVATLLVPVGGPWLKLEHAIDYVRAVGPDRVVPIHEAVLSEPGQGLARTLLTNLGGAGEPVRLERGTPLEL